MRPFEGIRSDALEELGVERGAQLGVCHAKCFVGRRFEASGKIGKPYPSVGEMPGSAVIQLSPEKIIAAAMRPTTTSLRSWPSRKPSDPAVADHFTSSSKA